jgi:dolichyl-phosphate beta-glucosyltransferase
MAASTHHVRGFIALTRLGAACKRWRPSMSAPPYLSIVAPAYNEARRLPPTLAKMGEFFQEFTRTFEVLIVVEKSTDGTLDIATALAQEQANFRAIDNGPKRGKGHAVRNGMLRARGEHIFYMDADLSVPLEEVYAFLAYLAKHREIDVLLGNRQHAQSRITRRQTRFREGLGKSFNRVLQTLGLAPVHDTQCGFKAFRRAAAHAIFSRQTLDGFPFDVEVLLLAERPDTRSLPARQWINSTVQSAFTRDSLAMLRDTFRVRHIVGER